MTHSTSAASAELTLAQRAFLLFQRYGPKQLITECMGKLANRQGGDATRMAIEWFIKRYDVNMREALDEDAASYASFNDFFTRPLKPQARPLAAARWVSPVDGAVSQLGSIRGENIFQAKGHDYTLLALLGGDAQEAARFENGAFATLYLSPRDYHRIHMPCEGQLRRMVYVPGDLYSVNPLTAQNIPGLFARNERLVCHFDTPHGPLALVLVGATVVGSMATVWHGTVNATRDGQIRAWDYPKAETPNGMTWLRQGDEMGRFMLGSTVVLCWPESAQVQFQPTWREAQAIRMGEAMAH